MTPEGYIHLTGEETHGDRQNVGHYAGQDPLEAWSRLMEAQPGLLSAHFVYQRIHTLAGRPLDLAAHLAIARRALGHIYGVSAGPFDESAVASQIARRLHEGRFPAKGSATVMLCFFPDAGVPAIVCERALLDRGRSLSSLRPKAVSYEYDVPYSAFPTGFQLSAAALFDSLALRAGAGATRSVRRRGDGLLSCGDAPLFAIRGRSIFTASLVEGAVDSVERRGVIEAAGRANLTLHEQAPLHPELRDYDELLFADAAGVTSLSECDGAKFMSLVAPRIAAGL